MEDSILDHSCNFTCFGSALDLCRCNPQIEDRSCIVPCWGVEAISLKVHTDILHPCSFFVGDPLREHWLWSAVELALGFVCFHLIDIVAVKATVSLAGVSVAIVARSDDVRAGSLVHKDLLDVVTVETTIRFAGILSSIVSWPIVISASSRAVCVLSPSFFWQVALVRVDIDTMIICLPWLTIAGGSQCFPLWPAPATLNF